MPKVDMTVLAEPRRLAAAQRARRLLPGLPMPLDAIARLAARLTGAPMAIVAVMYVEEEHFVGSFGLPEALSTGEPMPTMYSLCKYIVSADHPVCVADMALDSDLCEHAFLTEYGARAFAGVPLRDAADRTVGALLVVDVAARDFTGGHLSLLVEVSDLLAGSPTDATPTDATAEGDPGDQGSFLSALVDSLDTGVAAIDAHGQPVMMNRAMRQFHGMSGDWTAAALAHTLAAYACRPDGTSIPPEQAPILRALRGEYVRDDEMLVKLPGERVRALLGNAQPILTATGHRLGAVAALHEVTERRRVERFRECQLAVASALARAGTAERAAPAIAQAVATALSWPHVELWLATEVPDALRLAGHHSTVGDELASFVARPVVKGVGITGTVWAIAEPIWVADIGDTVHLVTAPASWVEACVRGGLRTVLAVPIPDGDDALGVLTCFAGAPEYDQVQLTALLGGIAEQVGQFLAHIRGEQLALQVARAKDDFLSLVGHEMRTPLTSISSYIDMLLDSPGQQATTEDTRQLLDGISRNTAALRTIVDDLLDLAAMESGYLGITERAINLAEIARQALRDVLPAATANGVTIASEIPQDLITSGDPQRLRQVLDNLLSNAVKYSPDGGEVCLTLTHDDRGTAVGIADTGIGIPHDDRGHLFQRFYRATNARHSGIPGTGLGLTIVRAIVEAHHGSIALADDAPTGTTITVRLPDDGSGRC